MTAPRDPGAAAEKWAFARRRTDVLSIAFVLDLHGRMFGDTEPWAGTIRSAESDRGVAVAQIRPDLQNALSDVKHWTEAHTYRPDERAVRFHHRLTQIRAFPHGNGRHARLMTDVLLFNLGRDRFSWGGADLTREGAAQERYFAALRDADQDNWGPLVAFVRS